MTSRSMKKAFLGVPVMTALVLAATWAAAAAARPGAARPPAARLAAGRPADTPADPAVLSAMQQELDRSMIILPKADPGVYFLSYTVSDRSFANVSGSNGALLNSSEARGRWLEVQARTGGYQLDDTHKVGDRPNWTSPGTS